MLGVSTSVYVLLAVLSITSSVLVGLVAAWAALAQKPHWSMRCGILLGMISPGATVKKMV